MPSTPNFGWGLPTVGGDRNAWGAIINGAFNSVDSDLNTIQNYLQSGWFPLSSVNFTHNSSDSPTFVINTDTDLTGILSVGMKIRLVDSGTQYFFITAIDSSTITVFGGASAGAGALSGGAISSVYYSVQKSPFGFPTDFATWTLEYTDDQSRTQNSPTQNDWYNLGSASLDIHIGDWIVEYEVNGQVESGGPVAGGFFVTLSTTNNSESHPRMTCSLNATVANFMGSPNFRRDFFTIASKTTYFLNTKVNVASISVISNKGDDGDTIIRAYPAYL